MFRAMLNLLDCYERLSNVEFWSGRVVVILILSRLWQSKFWQIHTPLGCQWGIKAAASTSMMLILILSLLYQPKLNETSHPVPQTLTTRNHPSGDQKPR